MMLNAFLNFWERFLRRIALFCLATGIFMISAVLAETVEDAAEYIAEGTYAIPIKRNSPNYPKKALRVGIEGWVVVNFSVNEDGTTDDIVVLNASINRYFEKEAIRTVAGWKYKPATWDGAPVAQANKTASIVFTMSDSTTALTGAFKKNFEKVLTAIEEGDLTTAKNLIEKMDSSRKRLLADVCHLDVLKAAYWRSQGDHPNTLHYLNRALVIADVAVEPALYIDLLRQAFEEEEYSHSYVTALKVHKTLLKVDKDIAADDPIHEKASQIQQVLDSDSSIITSGTIVQCADCLPDTLFWDHHLNRHHFSINQIEGQVGEVEILCGFQSVSLLYNSEAVWSVDKDWGQCQIRVFGDEGTVLELTEFSKGS
jgi:TonB family protein